MYIGNWPTTKRCKFHFVYDEMINMINAVKAFLKKTEAAN